MQKGGKNKQLQNYHYLCNVSLILYVLVFFISVCKDRETWNSPLGEHQRSFNYWEFWNKSKKGNKFHCLYVTILRNESAYSIQVSSFKIINRIEHTNVIKMDLKTANLGIGFLYLK